MSGLTSSRLVFVIFWSCAFIINNKPHGSFLERALGLISTCLCAVILCHPTSNSIVLAYLNKLNPTCLVLMIAGRELAFLWLST